MFHGSVAAQPGAAAAAGDEPAGHYARARLERDLEALARYRPSYPFWRHVYTIPDGHVVYGSVADGRLLGSVPVRGDWRNAALWQEPEIVTLLAGQRLEGSLSQRRAELVSLIEPTTGPVVHNATRGSFLAPGARRYGSFLSEWGAIFERFGVPAELGLAQAIVESGLRGRIRSEAGALGFCQWLPRNWERLKRLSPHVIEGYNQTTQVPYCAAYLTVLATKYGSFVPALSEHHAGGVNVYRAIANGELANGLNGDGAEDDIRSRYFLGSEVTLQLRQAALPGYRELVGTYGPRSFRYAEMVFGNTHNVVALRETIPQEHIYAMRAPRSISLEEVTRRARVSVDEARRFNPSLVRQVPARANVYLPARIEEFGPDVGFWHHPASREYLALLEEFLRLDTRYGPEDWDNQYIVPVLRDFQRRFRDTRTEEGTVMAAVMAYVIEEIGNERRAQILRDVRNSQRARGVLEQSLREASAGLARDTGE